MSGNVTDKHSPPKVTDRRQDVAIWWCVFNVAWTATKWTTANLISNVQRRILNMNYYTPVKNTTTFTSNYSNKWPFRSESKLRGGGVVETADGDLHAEKEKWKCSWLNVIFYMEILHKLRLQWMSFGLNQPTEQLIHLFIWISLAV